MSRFYKGFKLDDLEKRVHFCHSVALRTLSKGEIENDKNTDYRDKLVRFDKKLLNWEQFQKVSALNSIVNMNYQINNGGVVQYFDNKYHEYREAQHEQDVEQVDKQRQENLLDELLNFGLEVFSDHETENRILDEVISQFKKIYVEEEEQFETIYSNEEEEIWNEETEEWEDNPAYEEPYEETIGFEEVIYNDQGFDEKFFNVNDYLEMLIEGYAQYLYKYIEFELSRDQEKPHLNEMIQKVQEKMQVQEKKSEAIIEDHQR